MRQNQVGQPLITQELRDQVLGGIPERVADAQDLDAIKADFAQFGLPYPAVPPGNTLQVSPVLPKRLGDSMEEHFEQMAMEIAQPWYSLLNELMRSDAPVEPDELVYQSGWTRYVSGDLPERVSHPLENAMVFDVETMVKFGAWPVMAAAMTPKAWYVWLHPAVVTEGLMKFDQMLIPIGTGKLVAGHNVSYDRVRVEEEYTLEHSGNYFLDTMSTHIAVSGLASEMRKMYEYWDKEPSRRVVGAKWFTKGSPASLLHAYNFHVHAVSGTYTGQTGRGKPMVAEDKEIRDVFVEASSMNTIRGLKERLIRYNIDDIFHTAELLKAVLPKYRRANPSMTSFAAMVEMGSSILPVQNDWEKWIQGVEAVYHQQTREMRNALNKLADDVHREWLAGAAYESDPWLKHLDWTPAKVGKNKGAAAWYRSKRLKKNPDDISSKSRLAPLLLKITWEGKPIEHDRKLGWCFKVLDEECDGPAKKRQWKGQTVYTVKGNLVCRIPHSKGEQQNCGDPLTKDYISSFEDGLMGSLDDRANRILEIAAAVSYWTSVRGRVMDQKAVEVKNPHGKPCKVIVPGLIVHGTATRRAVEKLWLTTCAPKANKVGSELKSRVTAPDGYDFVAADFDAQEKRLAGYMGDSFGLRFGTVAKGILGGTPVGFTVISGSKAEKTDAHSQLQTYVNRSLWEYRTGATLGGRDDQPVNHLKCSWPPRDGIDRNSAKDPNFAILFGSGEKGLGRTYRKLRKTWLEHECTYLAKKSIQLIKGKQRFSLDKSHARGTISGGQWTQGTDSAAYNAMQQIAFSSDPRTPILESAISSALNADPGPRGDFMISKMNWTVQSSGQDLLHCTIVALRWICNKYEIDGRFLFSYHDEALGMAKKSDSKRFAAALNISHLWAWSYAAEQLRLNDVPANGAFFGSTNLDSCFRKEVNESVVTPSNPDEIAEGISLMGSDIFEDGVDPLR